MSFTFQQLITLEKISSLLSLSPNFLPPPNPYIPILTPGFFSKLNPFFRFHKSKIRRSWTIKLIDLVCELSCLLRNRSITSNPDHPSWCDMKTTVHKFSYLTLFQGNMLPVHSCIIYNSPTIQILCDFNLDLSSMSCTVILDDPPGQKTQD